MRKFSIIANATSPLFTDSTIFPPRFAIQFVNDIALLLLRNPRTVEFSREQACFGDFSAFFGLLFDESYVQFRKA